MEGVVGAEVSQKIRAAIKAKLMEIGVYVDEELPDYVMVMVANKRSKEQMDEDLELFLGKHTSLFTLWLHSVLQKLQEVTVANLGIKKKSSDESKKKKKSKEEKKVTKKKIKTEPFDDVSTSIKKEDESKAKDTEQIKKLKNSSEEAVFSTKKQGTKKQAQIEHKQDEELELKNISENITTSRSPTDTSREQSEEKLEAERKNSLDDLSQFDDLEDEDFINIRTDGELLDTNEELVVEEVSHPFKEKEDSSKTSSKESNKKTRSVTRSPPILNEKSQSRSDETSRKTSEKEVITKQSLNSDDKVVDARELLNMKKAAKELESKAKSKSRERSTSPPRRRKEDDRESNRRVYSGRDGLRRGRESEREVSSRRVTREEDDREQRRSRERDSYLGKRRSDERPSRRNGTDRIESRLVRRRSSSNEIPLKRPYLDKQSRNKPDDIRTSRSTTRRKEELQDGRIGKRGLVSRVVARPQEPEEEMDTSVPSVVKITPRPSRPAAQGPSSTLILKAISEANRSLANAPPRPDSTQRARKEPVITRTLRNQKIPPEKIAISITNHLALQNVPTAQETEDEDMSEVRDEDDEVSRSPRYDETARNKSPSPMEQQTEEDKSKKKVKNQKKQATEEEAEFAEVQEPEDLELQPTPEGDETREEASDPQFVVTLNGYDPDGLFVGMDVDGEGVGEGDEWMKEGILTSTPPSQLSPNLIAVELKPKVTERCKYWPACKLIDKCTFYHPTKLCNMFPNCKFGDTCLYIHPQCKFNTLCTRKDCIFAHTTAHTPLQPAAGPKVKTLYATSALLPCKFYPNCTNVNCQFAHPTRACRFGLYCTKKDCSFDHGQVASIDKLKWTRVPST